MPKIAKDKSIDSTLALYQEGYEFISNRCTRLRSDVFQTRLIFRKAICMRGAEAAKLFYDRDKFVRKGALPRRALKSFLGERGVQTLDGEEHRNRKMMFMELMTADNINRLTGMTSEYWERYIAKWERMDSVVLLDEAAEILCRAVCDWAGVPLREKDVKFRTRDFLSMIDSPAALGPRHWKGRRARSRAEKWIAQLISDVRKKKFAAFPDSAVHSVAWHRNLNGRLLDEKVAAVELINFLRPTVAVALYVVFVAHAMQFNPESAEKIDDADYADRFVQEVRRFYPFFPAVAAHAKSDFVWNGFRFHKGDWVLLDLYGTNHDPATWKDPERFAPERFATRHENNYDFIPQGGATYDHHRCAGEWITVQLMKQALHFLGREIEYAVPEQDLRLDLSRVPAIPTSGFVIANVKRQDYRISTIDKIRNRA
ncbi:MAG TPA: cytochrome P450 [Pyrinomonadaceae bacterium]|nr:cytochrome P450 [Pyrinomonadaceae bacterium]